MNINKWLFFGLRVIAYPFIVLVIVALFWPSTINFFEAVGRIIFWIILYDLLMIFVFSKLSKTKGLFKNEKTNQS